MRKNKYVMVGSYRNEVEQLDLRMLGPHRGIGPSDNGKNQ